MDTKELAKILAIFNFTKKELFVFETLLTLKETKVSRLAKECSLPRQSLYSILERLQDYKLVTESRSGRIKLFKTSIETIESALKIQEESIRKSIQNFKTEKERIKSKEVDNSNPKIAIYKGKLGLSYILQDMTKVYQTKKAKTFRAYTMSQFKEGFEAEFKEFIQTRSEQDVESRIFVPRQTDFSKILGFNKYKREFKVLDMEDFGSALYIVGNKTYLVSYRDNEGFIIENQNLALFLKEIFDIHWKNKK